MKRKRRWLLIGVATACAIVVSVAWLMRNRSATSLESRYAAGDLSGTIAAVQAQQRSLADHARRIEAHFLVANCYRQLGLHREFQDELERMKAIPGATDRVHLATAMYKTQRGELSEPAIELAEVLQSAGALESDAHSVVIQGLVATGKLDEAQQLLQSWRSKYSASPRSAPAQLEFMTAVWLNVSGEVDQAETKLIATLEQHPQHELSWLALGELYARPPHVRFLQSEYVLEQCQTRFPNNSDVHVRLARVRRRLGKGDASLSQLTAANGRAERFEKANIEFDLGHFQQAVEGLSAIGLSTPEELRRLTDTAFERSLRGQGGGAGGDLTDQVSWGATALALSGDVSSARIAFDDAADRTARLRHLQDLSNQQAAEPRRHSIRDEMDATLSLTTPFRGRPLARFVASHSLAAEQSAVDTRGMELYQMHCVHCHGPSGRGDGRAACNLFPAPRNFRQEPMRLISTVNHVPSDEDLAHTIRRGEPGTSMPAFEKLSENELRLLVDVVRQFMIDGQRELYARRLVAANTEMQDAQNGAADNQPTQTPSADAEKEWLAERTEPGSPLELPRLLSTPESVARGDQLLRDAGCANCHGAQSHRPGAPLAWFDSLGRPVKPPRLEADAFHGGDDASRIYQRITLGIPGTPHPALASTSDDMECLVAYICSLRSAPPVVLSNHQRYEALIERK